MPASTAKKKFGKLPHFFFLIIAAVVIIVVALITNYHKITRDWAAQDVLLIIAIGLALAITWVICYLFYDKSPMSFTIILLLVAGFIISGLVQGIRVGSLMQGFFG